MPALCNRRGRKRWRAQIKDDKGLVTALKWFGEGPKGGPEYRKAIAWEEETRKRLETEKTTIRTESLTVRKWANAYLKEVQRRRSKATYTDAKTAYKFLGMTFGAEFFVESLTPAEALRHLDLQNDERTGSAANNDRKNLARGWKWGMGFITGFPQVLNPFLTVERYPVNRKPRYVPPEEDYWKVMSVAEGQDKVLLTALFHLAARRGELFRLTWADVDFGNQRVRLGTKKTADGSMRYDWIPMTTELKMSLLWWWEHRQHKHSEFVFTVTGDYRFENQYEGEPFKTRQHFMEKICTRAGVKPFGFHAIRHLSAIILYHAGNSVAMIQAILRHENATTTERYLKRLGLDPERVKDAVKVFENREPGKVIAFPKNKTPDRVSFGG